MQQLVRETQALLGIALSPSQVSAFNLYQQELESWKQRINLTAIRKPEEVRRKHFLDSLSCLLAMQGTDTQKVIDVGTGAGFPGLPLKIAHPEMHLTLVESIRKKTKFLQHIVALLELDNVEILPARIELVGRQDAHREKYDWAVSRLVAPLPVLVEYLLPLVKVGGYILAQKGEHASREVDMAGNAMQLLGGQYQEMIPVQLPNIAADRYLVVILKSAPTPDKYPRREGVPTKRPL